MESLHSRMADESLGSSDDNSTDSDIIPDILESVMHTQLQIMRLEYLNSSRNTFPRIRPCPPNTTILKESEYYELTKKACSIISPKRRPLKRLSKNVASLICNRETGVYPTTNFSYANKCYVNNKYIPNHVSIIDNTVGRMFCGIYSSDGKYLLTACQDRYIRLYCAEDGSYRQLKSLRAQDFGWSIIDVAFSPDRNNFVYTSWSNAIYLCSVHDEENTQEALTFLDMGRRFCIFSVVFSSDGKELLGGANDGNIYIYDREQHVQSLKISAHEYDVNSVVFADDSSKIIYSGGDDGLVRVWDRRTMDDSRPQHVGCLAGHMDGVTHVDSRRDGRHLISNSKDQSIKLWDVRKFSSETAAMSTIKTAQEQTWDYRWHGVPKKLFGKNNKIDGDTSIMTYREHVVTKTLIRCRFSPVETTGQRFIYTGCGMGRIIVYDSLTGKVQQNINGHTACVRDVYWHPYRNEIVSSGWDGVVGKWQYRDPEYCDYLEDDINEKEYFHNITTTPLRRSQRLADKRSTQNNDS
ncbi:unnamed protein product [Brassicogethes aeneus]|uniref:DDB1- and CUL4-associated factor 11 n=1 Tax=Brassicogethes aeneus TaxID=1431903 RepID=A0A9P0FAD5_BRAAE|nr:unnamed protein product [Brassicogethes aeneus]